MQNQKLFKNCPDCPSETCTRKDILIKDKGNVRTYLLLIRCKSCFKIWSLPRVPFQGGWVKKLGEDELLDKDKLEELGLELTDFIQESKVEG